MKYKSVSLDLANTSIYELPAQFGEREWSTKVLGFEQDSELLPCPFCGSNDIRAWKEYAIWMECANCHARGPETQNRIEAGALWNGRVR